MESKTLYKWPIVNFSRTASRAIPRHRLNSDVFTLNGSNAKFSLRFYPTTVSRTASREYCSVFLLATDLGGAASIKLKYKIWVENILGEKIRRKPSYDAYTFSKVNHGMGYSAFLRHDRLYSPQRDFVKNDFVFICCEIRHLLPDVDDQKQFAIDMKEWEFFNNGFANWCTIQVDETEFKIGKNKLMAFSSVFETMFKSGMEEAQNGIIKMNDTTPMAIEAMIKYLYTQKVDESDESVPELYALGDKYEIDGLKKNSSKILVRKLNDDNIIVYLALAINHNDEFLKQGALDYLTANMSSDGFKELILSDVWTNLKNYDEKIAREIVREFFKVSNWH